MNFDIQNLGVLRIGDVEIWITETHLATWIIMGLLIIFGIAVRIRIKKFGDVPKGLQNVAEMMVETFDKFLKDTAGEKFSFLGSWFFTVFAFVLLSNISGLFFLRPPTADWATPFALALVTFVLIHVMGARYRKMKYLKSLFDPNPIFFPLNFIGELARPISLSFRMFGNILSGTILLTLFYSMTPIFLRFVIPAALHVYFDIFSGVLQTYVFCVLSLALISAASETEG